MPAVVDKNECTGCGLCIDECPSEAITFDAEGLATVNADECVDCGACVDVCPVVAITLK